MNQGTRLNVNTTILIALSRRFLPSRTDGPTLSNCQERYQENYDPVIFFILFRRVLDLYKIRRRPSVRHARVEFLKKGDYWPEFEPNSI